MASTMLIHQNCGESVEASTSGRHDADVGGCYAGVYVGMDSFSLHAHSPADLRRFGQLFIDAADRMEAATAEETAAEFMKQPH